MKEIKKDDNTTQTGVVFNDEKGLNSFSINIRGDKFSYLETVKALVRCLSITGDTSLNADERYYLGTLLEDMLPDYTSLGNKKE